MATNPVPVPTQSNDNTGLGYSPPEQPTNLINCELASNYANSYVSLAYASSYFSNHYNPAFAQQWLALTVGQQSQLLIQATSDIEQLNFVQSHTSPYYHSVVDSKGRLLMLNTENREAVKYNYYQSLQFPRSVDRHQDGSVFIPPAIQMAECEQALYVLTFDQSLLSNTMQGMISNKVTVGSLSVSQQFSGGLGMNLSPIVYARVKPYLRYGKRVVRG